MTQRIFAWITPNQLTVGRISAIPLLLLLIYVDRPWWNVVGCALFALACLTDYWDGELARSRGQITQLGKLLDPLADKMLTTALLVMLAAMDRAQVLPVIVIILREFAVSGLRQVAALEGVAIAAVRGAKWKTLLQMIATGILLLHANPLHVPLLLAGNSVLWLAMVWTLVTGYGYFQRYYSSATPKD